MDQALALDKGDARINIEQTLKKRDPNWCMVLA
jgi:hypothetical protein